MSKLVAIYELLDPGTLEKRYVGKSIDAKYRLKMHMSNIDLHSRCYADHWKLNMIRRGVMPILQIIEMVPEEIWEEREDFWIKKLRSEGHPLTNTAPGGLGGYRGVPYSAERRKKLSDAMLLRLWEQKLSGVIIEYSEDRRKQMSISAKARTDNKKAFGYISPLIGRKTSEDHKRRTTEGLNQLWAIRKMIGYPLPDASWMHNATVYAKRAKTNATPEVRAKRSKTQKARRLWEKEEMEKFRERQWLYAEDYGDWYRCCEICEVNGRNTDLVAWEKEN